MDRWKQTAALWALVWGLALVLAGCGVTTQSATQPPPQPPPEKLAPPPPPPLPAAAVLKILTYNVLADRVAFERRTAALAKLIEASDADIVCLQEVNPDFLAALALEPWFNRRYTLAQTPEAMAYANGNAILLKTAASRVQVVDHQSPQGRQSPVAWTKIRGRTVAIATCHLDSFLEDGPVRAKELDQIFGALTDADDCILAGDFNFGDGESPDSEHLDSAYTDLWRAVHPQNPGYTWNIQKSAMAAKGSFTGEASRRIDRILMKSKDGFWRAAAIAIIGDEPLTPGDTTLFPSDHFGLAGSWEAASPPGAGTATGTGTAAGAP